MPIGRTAWGDDVTDISSDNPNNYNVGELRESYSGTYGRQVYRFAKLDAAVSAVVGNGIMVKDGATTQALQVGILNAAPTPAPRMLGVAQVVVTAAYYCWLLCDGKGLVIAAAAGISANTALKAAAAGTFTDVTAAADEVGVFAHAAAAVGVTAVATIRML